VRQNQNILLIGPTGIGKSWLVCALAQKACRDDFSVMHKRTAELFRELAVAHVDGSLGRVLLKWSRVDVLVLAHRAAYDLKKLRGKKIIRRIGQPCRYESMAKGLKAGGTQEPSDQAVAGRRAGPAAITWRTESQGTRYALRHDSDGHARRVPGVEARSMTA
jgi:hypothetical protein